MRWTYGLSGVQTRVPGLEPGGSSCSRCSVWRPAKHPCLRVRFGGQLRPPLLTLPLPQGIDLYAEPGSLTALMGGSGAGKTVRAGGAVEGVHQVEGHVLVCGSAGLLPFLVSSVSTVAALPTFPDSDGCDSGPQDGGPHPRRHPGEGGWGPPRSACNDVTPGPQHGMACSRAYHMRLCFPSP